MKHHHRVKEPAGKNEVAINEGGSSVQRNCDEHMGCVRRCPESPVMRAAGWCRVSGC